MDAIDLLLSSSTSFGLQGLGDIIPVIVRLLSCGEYLVLTGTENCEGDGGLKGIV